MVVSRQRVVVQILLVWIVWHCQASGALVSKQQTESNPSELLTRSQEQNEKHHSLALQTAKQALELFRSRGDDSGTALALGQVARCYFARSDLNEAADFYKEALQLWQKQNNLPRQAETLNMLGFVEAQKGDWDNAISYYSQAKTLINDESSPALKGQNAAGLANLFLENGNPAEALTYNQRALEFYKETETERDDIRLIMLIGYNYLLLDDLGAAETHLQTSLSRLEESDEVSAAQCREYLAQLEMSRENYEAAMQYLEPALAIYSAKSKRKQEARVRALLGQIYERQGEFNRARSSYRQASEILRRISDRVSDAAVSFALGRLELNAGNYDKAEPFLKQSIEITERIRSTSTGRELTEAFSANMHARYAAYIECLMRKHQLQPSAGLDVLAFQASELARARSLAELLHDTQTNVLSGVDPKLVERERTLRQLLRASVDKRIDLLATAHNNLDLEAVEQSLARLREEYQQVREQILLQNPSFEQISKPTTYSLQQIQREVIEDDRTVLLEYFLGAEASYVWLVTNNSFVAHVLPKEAILAKSVNDLSALLSLKPNAEKDAKVQVAAQELGQMILGPVSSQLAGRRVIVVADGALNYVPFQVLSAGNKLLIEDAEVVNAPSASILGQLRNELTNRKPAANSLAAFGDAVFASNYAERRASEPQQPFASPQPASVFAVSRDIPVREDSSKLENIQQLFYVPAELKNIRELAGPTAFVATGFDATRQRLEETDLSKYSILHLATHGVFNPERPEKSGFYLSLVDRDGRPLNGFMTMRDVYLFHAPVDLVVLSACRTGLGKEVQGEGLIGLTRGFMYAGASSVASTLWRVDDQATAELMKFFYANMLQKQMTPAAALREAQNSIRQDPRWSSPHYWAAFTLQGEYKQKINVPASSSVASSSSTSIIQRITDAALLILALLSLYKIFSSRKKASTDYTD